MITWMQRHKKYLIITMWVSTIAFIGAGFVGWGQYKYGDKATAIAKVGDISISNSDLQKTYSRLYGQYSQMFQGNFDEEKAKQFGLQKQAIRQLIDQALILNLAQNYKIRITDDELLDEIKSQQVFYNDGVFDKDVYQNTLKQNRLSMKEYEDDVRKSMLIQKAFEIFNPKALPIEQELLSNAQGIQDKISYKILDETFVTPDLSEEKVKAYWEIRQHQYMTLPLYNTSIVTQKPVISNATEEEMQTYYNENKHDFKDAEGAILDFNEAKDLVRKALDDEASRKAALKLYIDFKKEKLDPSVKVDLIAINASNNIFPDDIFKEITELSADKAFLKPRKFGDDYIIVRLDSLQEPKEKSFEEAKESVTTAYISDERSRLLQELAASTLSSFTGTDTALVSRDNVSELNGLSKEETSEFLNAVFNKQDKRSFIELSSKKIAMYDILEQTLLDTSKTEQEQNVIQMKNSLLNRGLVQLLESKYPVEMFVKGL